MKNHLNPRQSTIVYRFKFNSLFRQPRESIQQCVAELRSLSEHCDFRDQLEGMIRDRLVCGVNDERIQCRLLAESRLDFTKELELATAMQIADKNTRDIHKITARQPGGEAQGITSQPFEQGTREANSQRMLSLRREVSRS